MFMPPATLDEVIARVGDRRILGEDGCWYFRGSHNAKGYPSLCLGRKRPARGVYVPLHRLVCSVTHGLPLDGDWHTLHSCDHNGCWRPEHLRPGDDDENQRDRWPVLLKDHHDEVVGMRQDGATLKEIAARFGVQHPAVSRYLTRTRG